MFKKLMSVVVITAILLCMLNASVGYAGALNGNEAEDFLSALGIVSSDSIDNGAQISREEFSFMLAKLLKIEGSTADEIRYFRDVENDSYAVNAINALAAYNIIVVPENREFRPKDAILFEEACKMIVCATGYELIANGRGGYPAGYVIAASQMGVKAGIVGKPISYNDAYKILFNTILAELPSADYTDSKGNLFYNTEGDASILTEYWDIYRAEGTVEALYGKSINSSFVGEKNKVLVNGVIYNLDSGCNIEPLFGGYAEVFYKKVDKNTLGTVLFARNKSGYKDIVIKPENIINADVNQITYYNDNDSKVTQKLFSAKVIYNGRFLENSIKGMLENINKGSVTVKDSDNDGKYDVVLVKDYQNFLVSTVNDKKIYNRLKAGDILTAGEYESERVFNGEVEADFASVKAGDILSVAKSVDGKIVEVIISANELSGTVTQVNNKNGIWYFAIDGVLYAVEKSYGTSLFGSVGQKKSELFIGKGFKIKLDSFSNIAYMEKLTDDMKAGVVIKGETKTDTLDKTVRFMLLTQEGIFEIFSLDDGVKINGVKQNDGGKSKLNEILSSADKFIRYTINDDGKVNAIVTAEYNNNAEYDGEKIRSVYNGINQQWYNSGRLGTSALTTKQTPIFMIPYGNSDPDEESCAVLTYSSLTDNIVYYCNAYHYGKDSVAADAAVVYYTYSNLYDNIDMYRPVIMFSRTEQRLGADGKAENILIGYTRGGRVEYIVPGSISFAGIEEGDMIMLNHGIDGNVVSGSKLSKADIEVVCKVSDLKTNKKPTWTQNTYHDYLYNNSETQVNDYYRADFQMSFGYVCKVSETQVAWSYGGGNNFSEAANITGNIVIYDSTRRDGDKIFVGKAADLITYGAAGYDCSKIIFRTRGGRLWETFCYN